MAISGKKVKIYCPDHRVPEEIAVNPVGNLICGDNQLISDFPPKEVACLFFCCECSTYISRATLQALSQTRDVSHCHICNAGKRTDRNLCEDCVTISFARPQTLADRKAAGAVNYECPSCEKKTEFYALKHNCPKLGFEFFTARHICHFCSEILSQKAPRRTKTAEYRLESLSEPQEKNRIPLMDLPNKLKHLEKVTEDLKTQLNQLSENYVALHDEHQALKTKYEEKKTEFWRQVAAIGESASQFMQDAVTKAELEQLRSEFEAFKTEIETFKAEFENSKSEANDYIKEQINEFTKVQDLVSDANNKEFTDRMNLLERRLSTLENKDSYVNKNYPRSDAGHLPYSPPPAAKTSVPKVEDSHRRVPDTKPLGPKGLVSDIRKSYPQMIPLVHYTMVEGGLKRAASESDTIVFYCLERDGVSYAIPASNSVQNEIQFKQYSSFYKASTTGLNGKLYVVEAAIIQWDEEIKGYRRLTKGLISIF